MSFQMFSVGPQTSLFHYISVRSFVLHILAMFAIQLDPEQANSIIPGSDRFDPVFGIESFEKDVLAEVLPRTGAEEPKLPTLIQVLFANCPRNSAVTLVSHLRRYCNRWVETIETVNEDNQSEEIIERKLKFNYI